MSKIVQFPVTSCNLTPEELCDFVKRNKPDVMIAVGLMDGQLYFKASNAMDNQTALWILENAKLHVLGMLDK